MGLDIKFDTSIIEKTILINKAFFLLESIKTINIKKCIVYLKTIKEAELFENILKTINIYFEFTLGIYNINYNTSRTKRNVSLTKFRNNKTKISIMLNVHILDEGIDIPECDSVYLTHPNNNPINIIQRISRANRIYPNKKIANILLWTKDELNLEKIINLIKTYISVKFNNINSEFINNKKSKINTLQINNIEIDNIEIYTTNNNINENINENRLKFLKKYSLINEKFIDDFYSFYNEGQNEYDFTINLDNIAFWLEIRKDNLKRLLESNFIKNQDYIEKKPDTKLSGTGTNNIKIIMLTYTCAKLLCMISKCEKANLIRNYYIELEKLLIKHKDDIVENLNRQLGIKDKNKTIINQNKKSGLIYILKVEEEIHKLGKSIDLQNRMKAYNVGRISELPIVFVYKTDNIDEIEKCIKDNLKQYQFKNKTELFKIDLDFIKDTIEYCTKKNALLLKRNKKLYESKDNKNWLIVIDKENIDNVDELFTKAIRYKRKSKSKSKSQRNTKSKTKSKI